MRFEVLLRRAAARTRHDQRGLTLVELMVGVGGALVIVFAAFTALTIANKVQLRTADRVEASQRGRLGMERITRAIRAQQCLTSDTPAMQWASDRGLQFYSSSTKVTPATGEMTQQVARRRIEWVPRPAASQNINDGGVDVGDIVERVWTSQSTAPPYVFPTTETSINVLAQDVEPDGSTHMFRYFGYDSGQVGRPSATPYPLVAFTSATLNPNNRPSVADANLARVVLVEIRYLSRPRRGQVSKSLTVPFFNRVSVRTADPSDPMRSPLCL